MTGDRAVTRPPARPRRGSIAIGVALVGAVIAGCNAGPVTPPTSSPGHFFGQRIDPGPAPDPVTCQHLLRSDIRAAIRIRTELMTPGVATDGASARAAAADPASDTTLVGVPLTALEVRALRGNGIALEPPLALSSWVHVAAPERFGGIWLREEVPTVAVLDGDDGAVAIARCIEPPGTREIWAEVSYAAGEAIKDRITGDLDRWTAQGVQVTLVDFDETAGIVEVGVAQPTADIGAAFRAAYGPLVQVHQEAPAVPL